MLGTLPSLLPNSLMGENAAGIAVSIVDCVLEEIEFASTLLEDIVFRGESQTLHSTKLVGKK